MKQILEKEMVIEQTTLQNSIAGEFIFARSLCISNCVIQSIVGSSIFKIIFDNEQLLNKRRLHLMYLDFVTNKYACHFLGPGLSLFVGSSRRAPFIM